MANLFRRAGAEIAKIIASAADPGAVANQVQVYSKVVTGVAQLFGQASDGTIYQLTPGSLLAVQQLAGAGNWTPTPGARNTRIRWVGGGGAGGGAAGGAATAGGGGGSSGVYVEQWFKNQTLTGGAYSVGAAGAAGAAGANEGGVGGDTTITVNGGVLTAKGGLGGKGRTNVQNTAAMGGGLAAGSSAGDAQSQQPGTVGWSGAGAVLAIGGNGGSNPLGIGGQGGSAGVNVNGAVSGTGSAGMGFGGGGGGAAATIGNNQAGNGSIGTIIVEEFS